MKIGRNSPCPCGSGKKQKHCCGKKRSSPASTEELFSRGIQAFQLEDYDQAGFIFEKLHSTHPKSSAIALNLCAIYRQQNRLPEALKVLSTIKRVENHEEGLYHQTAGQVTLSARQLQRARKHLETAHRLDTGMETWLALSELEREEGDIQASQKWLERILESQPHHPRARMDLSLLQLMQQDFLNGYTNARYRVLQNTYRPDLFLQHLPDLKGREIVLHAEMGIGDELFFLRWLTHLQSLQPANIEIRLSPKTLNLLRHHLTDITLVQSDGSYPPLNRTDQQHRLHLMLGDLPLLAAHSGGSLTPPALALASSAPQPPKSRLVGLCTRAGAPTGTHTNDVRHLSKTIPRAWFFEALRDYKGQFLILDRNLTTAEKQEFLQFADCNFLEEEHEDLTLQLPVLRRLEAMIGVSSTCTHLLESCAPTTPALTIVPWPPEFRWGLEGPSAYFPRHSVCRIPPLDSAQKARETFNLHTLNWARARGLL